jgi:hypothetical protein
MLAPTAAPLKPLHNSRIEKYSKRKLYRRRRTIVARAASLRLIQINSAPQKNRATGKAAMGTSPCEGFDYVTDIE